VAAALMSNKYLAICQQQSVARVIAKKKQAPPARESVVGFVDKPWIFPMK
jgi:hypothetical protein